MKYYCFHMGDYTEKTAHLTWDEDAAYRKLIDWYYSLEGPLPSDTRAIYRKIKADTEDRRAATDAVLSEFFTLTEEGYRHEKCDERIAKFYQTSKSASERGKAGAAAKKARAQLTQRDDKLQLAKAKQPNTHNPIPITHPPSTPSTMDPTKGGGDEDFEKFEKVLRAIEGIDQHPVVAAPVIAPMWQLAQQGYDLKTEVVPVIRGVLANAKPGSIRSWGYFREAIENGGAKVCHGSGGIVLLRAA